MQNIQMIITLPVSIDNITFIYYNIYQLLIRLQLINSVYCHVLQNFQSV